jgi:phospholipid/cholesterol/gamma-HCH transport system substrate-binding protein
MTRRRLLAALAVVLIALVAAAAIVVVRETFFRPKTINADFTTVTGIYPGDDVRVSGVKVGKIDTIQPVGTQAKVVMHIDHSVPIPADAKAVIVAQNVVAARYVELAPAYRSSGPTMPDGTTIPVDRTAVPVEWDEVKEQLMRLATDLGPTSQVSTTSVGRFIDSAANALGAGNGDKLRQTLAQLSGVGRILANGSGNIVDFIKNLQTFVTALRNSDTQIVQFNDRLATLTSVLDDNRSELDAALTDLSTAVGEVQRFISETRDKTSEQIARLADVTQNLVDHRRDLEQILHITPNAVANTYYMADPQVGRASGVFVGNNFSNPVWFICSMIGAVENVTAAESSKLCAEYLGPALRSINFNYGDLAFSGIPIPFNPFISKTPSPDETYYTEPGLAPGGTPKPGPPETPPAVSAYQGLPQDRTEQPPPWGLGLKPGMPGPTRPEPGPPPPPPRNFLQGVVAPGPPPETTGAPPGPPTLPDMLLPAERPPS